MNVRVLMFGWEFPPFNSGGLGTACHGLTRALIDASVDVKFVLPHELPYTDDWIDFVFAGQGTVQKKYVQSLLSPYMTPSMYVKWRMEHGSNADPFTDSLIDEVYRYSSLAGKIAEETDHNVIHAHEWLAYLAGIEARKIGGKPYVAHVHSTEYDRSGGHVNQQVHAIEEEGLKSADHIIAVSQYTKDIVMDQYNIKSHKIDVVHNGVHQTGDSDHVVITDEKVMALKKLGYKIVLYAGRLTLHKGPDYFVKAAKRVLEYAPKTLFVIAGSGDMEYRLVEMVTQLGMSENFIFTGWLRGDQLAHVFHSADVYVLPSVSEPFGIAPLEAISYGTPVIVSRQSGVSEALHHALKVDFWDIDDMAHKILSVIGHESLYDELQLNGKEEVKKFNWQTAAQRCVTIYESLI